MLSKDNITRKIIESIQDKKGTNIAILDLSSLENAPASEFVICSGKSTTQVTAIADAIREDLLNTFGIKPYNYEGYRNSQWIVIDYGNIFIHIFLPDFREFYDLEDLWNDVKIEKIPDLD